MSAFFREWWRICKSARPFLESMPKWWKRVVAALALLGVSGSVVALWANWELHVPMWVFVLIVFMCAVVAYLAFTAGLAYARTPKRLLEIGDIKLDPLRGIFSVRVTNVTSAVVKPRVSILRVSGLSGKVLWDSTIPAHWRNYEANKEIELPAWEHADAGLMLSEKGSNDSAPTLFLFPLSGMRQVLVGAGEYKSDVFFEIQIRVTCTSDSGTVGDPEDRSLQIMVNGTQPCGYSVRPS